MHVVLRHDQPPLQAHVIRSIGQIPMPADAAGVRVDGQPLAQGPGGPRRGKVCDDRVRVVEACQVSHWRGAALLQRLHGVQQLRGRRRRRWGWRRRRRRCDAALLLDACCGPVRLGRHEMVGRAHRGCAPLRALLLERRVWLRLSRLLPRRRSLLLRLPGRLARSLAGFGRYLASGHCSHAGASHWHLGVSHGGGAVPAAAADLVRLGREQLLHVCIEGCVESLALVAGRDAFHNTLEDFLELILTDYRRL
mmetsp:Transcript_9520/g.22438  ORF Transcript_9520/g.22438 Transcript_9520/m.22438 type:complete len:251 (+) Transcript_9520:487-1239(+)